MNRRDFLTLSTSGGERILELSCERLYMRYVDARSGVGRSSGEPAPELKPWEGEPPTAIKTPTTSELFEELERELAGADVLRVLERDWLTGEEFGREVEAHVEAFRRRGGRVEFHDSTAQLTAAGQNSG